MVKKIGTIVSYIITYTNSYGYGVTYKKVFDFKKQAKRELAKMLKMPRYYHNPRIREIG